MKIAQRTALEISEELTRARAKFPMPNRTYVALCEEVGELAKALLDCKPGMPELAQHVYHEAKQVAAMAVRIMEEGDKDTPSYSPYLGISDADHVKGGQPLVDTQTGIAVASGNRAAVERAHEILTNKTLAYEDRIFDAVSILSRVL